MIRQHLKLQEAFPCHLKFIDQDYDHVPLVRQTNGLTNFNNNYYYEYCYTGHQSAPDGPDHSTRLKGHHSGRG